MPDPAQHRQQTYLHQPPTSDSDVGPIVVLAPPKFLGTAVVAQPPAETQVVPIIFPPPGALRQESPSRGSPLSSSSGFSSSSPTTIPHPLPSDIHGASYPRSRRTSPSSWSSIISRIPNQVMLKSSMWGLHNNRRWPPPLIRWHPLGHLVRLVLS